MKVELSGVEISPVDKTAALNLVKTVLCIMPNGLAALILATAWQKSKTTLSEQCRDIPSFAMMNFTFSCTMS